ncbi:tautomerase family protein [Saccharothrix texasensis]|uniref:4-oxalocrotonate tautomerase n=1 Tax=Saccharothrix texasensis TaxID=103734 RepID=A0A3N1H022_9PSEU|nr:tautomerase family protein [Saccharothrix texasensis]ROP35828.1 4-oxalocrotonate tautomerase [Saccharothrix texasensis]
MPIVSVTTWPGSDDQTRRLAQEPTKTVREVTGAPMDKITVYVQEVPRERWAEGGVLGTDPDFAAPSRRA